MANDPYKSESLDECKQLCDYPMYIRGKIAQIEGELDKALYWFENALALSPQNAIYLSRIGQVNFLLGNHEKAAEILLKSVEKDSTHVCGINLQAQECLTSLNNLNQSPEVLKFMAELFQKKKDFSSAARAYEQVIKSNCNVFNDIGDEQKFQLEPDNVEALTNLGLLYYQEGKENNAFEMFGRALSYDPTDGNAILAAGSIIQTNGDFDVALSKYRVAAERCDYNGSLWNNIGMCFFGKGKQVAAISCLKKAYYLCPLDWKISYNLGLVHQSIKQYVSAYHFFSAAVNLNPTYGMGYAALAAVLSHLGDQANARKAYEKAIQLDAENPQIFYNYAIFEMKQKNVENAIKLAKMCETALASSHPHYKVCKFSVQNVKTVHWCSKQNILCNLKIA
ncbi:unnamed protein product [Enterobius vermicularis]|uniref:TPR_REGION domain-containing protein n=1 Tax=Enterobius vermicularis TaxID=51028 RepID=A0A0N4V4I0_ENTVE|nr:unnamed protein product [Enterobius vermicularis]